MKLVYCVSIVSALLMLCEGLKFNLFRIPQSVSPPDPWPTPAAPATTTTTTTAPKPTTTTRKPKPTTTPFPTTTAGRGVNLKGKMVTVSQYSGVTFYPPNYSIDRSPTTARANTTTTTIRPTTTTTTTTITTKPRTTTAWPTTPTRPSTTTAPVTKGVTVCLRFLTDVSSVDLFTLDPYSSELSFSLNNQWYILKQRYYSNYNLVSVNPVVPRWPSVRTQPWTSVCVVLDSIKNVVQVFQGGLMSIRKIPQYKMVWSGRPVLTVSGFDGQVTDLEVWDYPLKNSQIFSFMQNYGSSGNVLTWSNISYRPNGNILVEDVYEFGQGPISSSEGDQQPIRSGRGRDQRLKYKKTLNGEKLRKRQMI